MARDKTVTHQKIIDTAKEYFLRDGYDKVSMRDIAKAIDLTPAALYRHFPSKEEMFSFLVEPMIKQFYVIAVNHNQDAVSIIENGGDLNDLFRKNSVGVMRELIGTYHDEMRLLLCCSQGTKYENFVHDVIVKEQKATLKAIKYLQDKGFAIANIDEHELHVLLSAYVTALFEPIVHDWPLDRALHSLDVIEDFFIPGWKKILNIK